MKTAPRRRNENGYHSNSGNNNNNNNNSNNVFSCRNESVPSSDRNGFKFFGDAFGLRDRKGLREWIVYVLPVLACLSSYSNGLEGDFVHDDVFAIRENRDVVDPASAWSLKRLLTDDFWGAPLRANTSHKSYRPLCVLSYRLNFLVSRLDLRPYHVVNLLLHILCTLLVCHISRTVVFETTKTKAKLAQNCNGSSGIGISGNGGAHAVIRNKKMAANGDGDARNASDNVNSNATRHWSSDGTGSGSIRRTTGSGSWAAMVTGLVFAVHPIHTEAVTGLVGRADVLACFFFLMSFLSHHCAIVSSTSPNGRHFGSYALSVVMATAAMLSKEHGVMALVVNSADDVISAMQEGFPEKTVRKSRCRWWRCRYRVLGNAFTFLTLFYCRWSVMGSQLPLFNETDNPAAFATSLKTRLLTFLYLPVFNTYLLLYPRTLSYDWQYGSIPLLGDDIPGDIRLWSVPVFYGILAFSVFKAVRYLKNRSLRPLQYGLLLSCVPFVPATNLFFTVGFVVAERVLYIPSVGYCLLLGAGLRAFSSTAARRRFVGSLLAAVVIIMIGRTRGRNAVWRDRETLFRSGVETLPDNAKMHYNYANYLRDADRSAEAIQHFREAIRLYPKFASAHNNLGLLLTTDPKEAEQCYRTTIKFNPKHANAHLNLGVMYMNSGHRSSGLPLLEKAAELYPRYSLHLANALISVGKDLEALETLRKGVVDHQLHDVDTLRLYTQQLVRAGLYEEAEGHVNHLLKTSDLVQTLVDQALILYNTGRQSQAEDIIERALRSSPAAETLKELSYFYQKTNQNDRALSLLERARESDPENLGLLHATAISLSALGRYDEAERLFTTILSSEGEDVDVLRGLSSMYGAQRRHREGLSVIDKSVRILEKRVPGVEVELVKALNMKASHERDLQQYEDAARTYQRLLEFDCDNVHARINLGAILHLQGNLEEARIHYVRAERLSPENRLVRENLHKVDRLLQQRGQ